MYTHTHTQNERTKKTQDKLENNYQNEINNKHIKTANMHVSFYKFSSTIPKRSSHKKEKTKNDRTLIDLSS